MGEDKDMNQDGGYHTFEREVLDRLIKIEVKIDDFKDLDVITTKNQQEIIKLHKDTDDQEKRITAIENSNTWLWRSIAGAAIASVISILFTLLQHGIIK